MLTLMANRKGHLMVLVAVGLDPRVHGDGVDHLSALVFQLLHAAGGVKGLDDRLDDRVRRSDLGAVVATGHGRG